MSTDLIERKVRLNVSGSDAGRTVHLNSQSTSALQIGRGHLEPNSKDNYRARRLMVASEVTKARRDSGGSRNRWRGIEPVSRPAPLADAIAAATHDNVEMDVVLV
jgi:hypothetical protein